MLAAVSVYYNTTGASVATPILSAVPGAAQQICVRVRLFAVYREQAGTNRLEVPLAPGARVSDLVAALAERVPALTSARGLVAVNQEYVTADHVLRDGDEAALIPPVSGG
jgi:molybdopterin synthase catalytic subunit